MFLELQLGTINSPSDRFDPAPANVGFGAEKIISQILGTLTIVAGVFFILMFFIAAFNWLTAGGDSGKVTKARDRIIQAITGLILIIAAYAIIGVLGNIIGIKILNLNEALQDLTRVIPITAPRTNMQFQPNSGIPDVAPPANAPRTAPWRNTEIQPDGSLRAEPETQPADHFLPDSGIPDVPPQPQQDAFQKTNDSGF